MVDGKLSRVRKYIFTGVAFAIILFIGFSATLLLSGAEITVKPRTHDTTVQASFVAKMKPGAGELGYELLTLEEEGERQVAATGKEEVTEKASGEITILNAQTNPQKLVKNTRFEGPGGLIYRISDSVEIPAATKDSKGTLVPGAKKAKVVADGSGETYNIASVRLSVPGLKGSDQYDVVYGEVDAKGIQGGFEGTRFIIDETELGTAKQQLHNELRDKLLARIKTEQPNGFVAYASAITFNYDALPAADAGNEKAVIKERAQLVVPLFNKTLFASFLAKSTLSGYAGEPVSLKDPASVTFKYEQDALQNIATLDTINFTLSGPLTIIWNFDADRLKKDLAGVAESNLEGILAKYPAIDKAKAVIRPLWKSSFPKNTEEIVVTEVMEMN